MIRTPRGQSPCVVIIEPDAEASVLVGVSSLAHVRFLGSPPR
jgi:hypothetical protein